MARIAKETRSFHRRIDAGKVDKSNKKQKSRKKSKTKQLLELKSITFEFENIKIRDSLIGIIMKALKEKEENKYFVNYYQDGNVVTIFTNKEKQYKATDEDYIILAEDLLDQLAKIERDNIWNVIHLVTRKGKKELLISVNIQMKTCKEFSKCAQSLDGIYYIAYYEDDNVLKWEEEYYGRDKEFENWNEEDW